MLTPHTQDKIAVATVMVTASSELVAKKYLTIVDLQKSVLWLDIQPYVLLGINNPRQLLYHYTTALAAIPTCTCGENLAWHSDRREYRKYCSKRCTARATVVEKKKHNLSTIGVEWHSQTTDWAAKVKQTSLRRFGVDHYSKTVDHTARVKETSIRKYGVESAAQSKEVKDKVAAYFITKYGVSNPFLSEGILSKIRATNQQQFGVDNQKQAHYSTEFKQVLADSTQLDELCKTMTVLEIAKKYNVSTNPVYSAIKDAGILLTKKSQSNLEIDVHQFIQTLYNGLCITNDRSILKTKQLDLFFPDIKLAIECNGSYWHSELNGRTKFYHSQKSTECAKQNIQLIHIWEHHWTNRTDVVKSMLTSVFNCATRIFARKCTGKRITKSEADIFLNKNHLHGCTSAATACYGLFLNNELLAVMTFAKCRFGKTAEWELIRFANKINHTVVGGASKLFSMFVVEYAPASIVSYSDISNTRGNMYQKLGFVFSHQSNPNYFYTHDYCTFYSRQKFQKHKLKKQLSTFDAHLSEWQNMQNNKWDRIWDCGNKVFIWVAV